VTTLVFRLRIPNRTPTQPGTAITGPQLRRSYRCLRQVVREVVRWGETIRYGWRAGELIGYARCSTVPQNLTAQREILASLGVADDRIYLDKGLTGTNRARPGLDQALAAVRSGDTLVVPKLDRLARSVPTHATSATGSPARGIKLSFGGQVYDRPTRSESCS
jgi:Resolvase, N terminal domain